jgi:hypothetical protein
MGQIGAQEKIPDISTQSKGLFRLCAGPASRVKDRVLALAVRLTYTRTKGLPHGVPARRERKEARV